MFPLYTFTMEFISALCHGCVTQLFLQRHLFFFLSFCMYRLLVSGRRIPGHFCCITLVKLLTNEFSFSDQIWLYFFLKQFGTLFRALFFWGQFSNLQNGKYHVGKRDKLQNKKKKKTTLLKGKCLRGLEPGP